MYAIHHNFVSSPARFLKITLSCTLGLCILMATRPSKLEALDTVFIPDPAPEDQNSVFSLGGHFRDLFVYYPVETYSLTGENKKLVSNLMRVRLSPQFNFSEKLIVHMDFDNEIIMGNYLKSPEFDGLWRPSDYNDLFKLSREPVYDEDLYYRTRIHRLYAKIAVGNLTITGGRQLVRFGSGRLWNPLDIMNPISPTALEGIEEQKGIDALRMEYYINATTEIGLVIDQKRYRDNDGLSSQNTNAAGRIKVSYGNTELAGLGGRIAHRAVGGIDISTIVLDGMVRGGLLYSDPEEGTSFVQGSAGYEYTFPMGQIGRAHV